MAAANITTIADDGERVGRLFEAIAVLDGLEAFAEREEEGTGAFTSIAKMSRISRAAIEEVIASMNP